MKKLSLLILALFLTVITNSFAQTTTATTPTVLSNGATTDFFAGKWDISVIGTPNGDSKLTTELIRKDGKLTGELTDPTGKAEKPIPINDIIEEGNKIILSFEAQSININMDLVKVDDDNLKGSIMSGRFDATAKRIKISDFFAGRWEISILGTPQGDAKMITNLVRKDGKLTGELKDPSDDTKPAIPITSLEEGADKITIGFTASGYDLELPLSKVDDNNLAGKLMDMFETKAVRIKE